MKTKKILYVISALLLACSIALFGFFIHLNLETPPDADALLESRPQSSVSVIKDSDDINERFNAAMDFIDNETGEKENVTLLDKDGEMYYYYEEYVTNDDGNVVQVVPHVSYDGPINIVTVEEESTTKKSVISRIRSFFTGDDEETQEDDDVYYAGDLGSTKSSGNTKKSNSGSSSTATTKKTGPVTRPTSTSASESSTADKKTEETGSTAPTSEETTEPVTKPSSESSTSKTEDTTKDDTTKSTSQANISELTTEKTTEATTKSTTKATTEATTKSSYQSPIPFDSLKSEGATEVVAWLDIPSTSISYPVMQHPADGNSDFYYLKKNIYGKYSKYGSLFIEKINSPNFSDTVTIIYGHDTANGTMFGDLETTYASKSSFKSHLNVTVYTPTAEHNYVVYCGVTTDNSNILRSNNFSNENSYNSFIKKLKTCSGNFNTSYEPKFGDKLLILETCKGSDSDRRYIVVCKEI